MKFESPYWTNKTKIEMLQRWILVHSYLYYELDRSVISDQTFDKNCVQLHNLKRKHGKDFKESRYGYAMMDFDGSTGFGYFDKLDPEHERIGYERCSQLKGWYYMINKIGENVTTFVERFYIRPFEVFYLNLKSLIINSFNWFKSKVSKNKFINKYYMVILYFMMVLMFSILFIIKNN